MHRSGGGLCKFDLRARAEERQQWKEKEEYDKKAQLGFNAEQAVHLIPFLLLACLLVLYIFSYTPVEGSVPENDALTNRVKEFESGIILVGSKKEALQTFSVYNHRSLHQLQKKQQKLSRYHLKEQKEMGHLVQKENKHGKIRTRPKKNSFPRKTRIVHTH